MAEIPTARIPSITPAMKLARLLEFTYDGATQRWTRPGTVGVGAAWNNTAYNEAVDKLMPELTGKQAAQLKTHVITQYAETGPATIHPGQPGYIDMKNLPKLMPADMPRWDSNGPMDRPGEFLRPKSRNAENARAALAAAVTFCRLEEHTPGDVTDMAEQFLEWLTKQQENP